MIGVLVNTATVVAGSLFGLLCKKGLPKRVTDAVMIAIGLCTVYIGVSGTLKGQNTLVLIGSMVLGTALGTLLNIDGRISALGEWVGRRVKGEGSVAQGFVTGSLLFCMGAMTIVGSLNAGLTGDNEQIFTKSLLDLISSAMLAASLGVGVLCSAAFVLVFQGALVLMAGWLAPLLTEAAIAEMTCAGSLVILGLGLNLTLGTKLKVADMLPAIVFAAVFGRLFGA